MIIIIIIIIIAIESTAILNQVCTSRCHQDCNDRFDQIAAQQAPEKCQRLA